MYRYSELIVVEVYNELFLVCVVVFGKFCGKREWNFLGGDEVFCYFLYNGWVVVVVDKKIVFCLVLQDVEFGVDIVLYDVIVLVKVVWCDVGQNGDFCFEIFYIVQLEGGQFKYENFFVFECYLLCEVVIYIFGQFDIYIGFFQYVVNYYGGGCFFVVVGNVYFFSGCVLGCKFDFGNYFDFFFLDSFYDGCFFRNIG